MRIKLALSIIFTVTLGHSLCAQPVERIVAVVNQEVILQSDVDQVLALAQAELGLNPEDSIESTEKLKQLKENIVKQLVEEKLVLSEAKKHNIEIDQALIEERLEKVRAGFPSEADFDLALEKQGLTLKSLRDIFRDQELKKKVVDYFVRAQIKIDPLEINQYYQEHQKDIIEPKKAQVKSLLFKADESGNGPGALKEASAALERLKKGESFEALAEFYAKEKSLAEAGDLGLIEQGQLMAKIDEAIFSLQSGEHTDVIKTPQGWGIFKVAEGVPQRQLSFTEAQPRINEALYNEKFSQIFRQWIDELKKDAQIEIRE